MKITLDTPKDIVIVPQYTQQFSEIEIEEMIDRPSEKRVRVRLRNLSEVTLWEGSDYDEIGQWTDQDVIDRIKEIYNIPGN
jgi:hypothetical protein